MKCKNVSHCERDVNSLISILEGVWSLRNLCIAAMNNI